MYTVSYSENLKKFLIKLGSGLFQVLYTLFHIEKEKFFLKGATSRPFDAN